MNTKTISMFLATYENKNISKAANELFLTKQAISKSIKLLEQELGVKLFVKIKSGFEPTDECHKVYKIIKDLKENLDSIEDYYELKHNPYSIRISNNNVENITKYYTMALGKYSDKNVMYSFENIDPVETYEKLLKDECDIGIFPIPDDMEDEIKDICASKNIKIELLLKTDPCIIVKNTHSLAHFDYVTPKDLMSYKRVGLIREKQDTWFFNKHIEAIDLTNKIGVRTNTVRNAIDSLKDTDYYYLSIYFENDIKYLKGLKMIPLKDTGTSILLLLGYNKNHLYDTLALYFMDLVKRHYRGEEIED